MQELDNTLESLLPNLARDYTDLASMVSDIKDMSVDIDNIREYTAQVEDMVSEFEYFLGLSIKEALLTIKSNEDKQ